MTDSADSQEAATEIVDHHLEARVASAGSPAGLRETVIDLVAEAFPHHMTTLMGQQLDALTNPSRTQWPDAYLADESITEDALQQAAAGLRTALAGAGHMTGKAQTFERNAAARLRDDPRAALRAELARVPRPVTRPKVLQWSLDPAPWFSDSPHEPATWPPPGLRSVVDQRHLPNGATALRRVDGGPYEGWVQIGLVESQHTPARRYPDQPARQLQIFVGLEASSSDAPGDSLPVAQAPWQLWTRPLRHLDPADARAAAEHIGSTDQPLVALTNASSTPLVDAPLPSHGLGLPHYVLAPTDRVITLLGLQPTAGIHGFSLSDASGEALIGRQWRGHLVHDGNYKPLLPAVEGADLLIRPDLFTRLHNTVGAAHCRVGISVIHLPSEEDDHTTDKA
ncbi:hypothetical protein AB0A05_37415 [Streptomyces sp. NPDC046374]|uniref:hypothetical protein n=1 Tax=Streptomyces sp. NPDC046374 TaxID=3154917 RepID=UPI00340D5E45